MKRSIHKRNTTNDIEQVSHYVIRSFMASQSIDEIATSYIFATLKNSSLPTKSKDIIEGYTSQLYKDNSFTYDHSIKVAWYAAQLGSWCKLSKKDIHLLMLLGLLHDIGKIGMPEPILNKKDKLTEKEFELIKGHPAFGSSWLKAADCFPDKIIDIVASHHEKCNGTGYPAGKRDSELDKLTKILTISDIYEAISSERPYKSAQTPEETIEVMADMAAIHEIDTDIFDIFKLEILKIAAGNLKNHIGEIYNNINVKVIGYDEHLNAPVCKIFV